jgi:hypothetical protein
MWIKSEDGALLNLDYVHEIALKHDNDVRGGIAWRVSVTGDSGVRIIRAFPYTDKASSDAAHKKAEVLLNAIESSLNGSGGLIETGAKHTA